MPCRGSLFITSLHFTSTSHRTAQCRAAEKLTGTECDEDCMHAVLDRMLALQLLGETPLEDGPGLSEEGRPPAVSCSACALLRGVTLRRATL